MATGLRLTRPRPKWRNWQMRRTQNPVPLGACGFDSHLRHRARGGAAPPGVSRRAELLSLEADLAADLARGVALRIDHHEQLTGAERLEHGLAHQRRRAFAALARLAQDGDLPADVAGLALAQRRGS